MLNAVLYTDGSARPNPGNAGWGVHGYIYDPEGDNLKPYVDGGVKTTDKGYSDHVKDGLNVTPISFIDSYGSFDHGEYDSMCQTNNLGEITALYKGMHIAFKHGATDILLYSDSAMCVDLCQRIEQIHKKDYRKNDGQKYVLEGSLREIYMLVKSIKEVGGRLTFRWIKGHKGFIGNEQADRLASIGLQHTKDKVYKDNTNIQELKSYKNVKSTKPDLICLPRIYFSSNIAEHVPGEYFMAGYVTTKPDNFYVGKKTSDSIYALVKLRKTNKQIEDVIYRHQYMTHRYNKLVRLDINSLFKKDMNFYYHDFGTYSMLPKPGMHGISEIRGLNGEVLSMDEIPSCLAYKALEVCRELSAILGPYMRGEDLPSYISLKDITDVLYDDAKKGKKLKAMYVNSSSKISLINPPIDLYFRYNLPERNVMKRLENKDIKLLYGNYVIEGVTLFDFCIIESSEGYMIWSNRYARRLSEFMNVI